jgi:hypothetical protein
VRGRGRTRRHARDEDHEQATNETEHRDSC